MIPLSPLEVLFDPDCGADLPLPDDLRVLYGRLQFPPSRREPYLIGNFVASLDGVVALGSAGTTDGDAISGSSPHDSMLMGLLRAASDAVIVGAGTLKKSSLHIWTPEFVFPRLGDSYRILRTRLGLETPPVFVVVTGSGMLDPDIPAISGGHSPVAVVTTEAGEKRIRAGKLPERVRVIAPPGTGRLTIPRILGALQAAVPGGKIFLVEGGPSLIGQFFDAGMLDELFLTLSPRLAGRDGVSSRPGLVSGAVFLPDRLLSGTLSGVRKGGNHLFLRYAFRAQGRP
jgi:riboflavin biosynthesis pyrimidine reductase